MTPRTSFFALLFVVASSRHAWGQQGRAPAGGPALFGDAGATPFAVTRDVAYKQVGGKSLTLDFYRPSRRGNSGNPVVLVLHGGPYPPDSEPKVKNDEFSRSLGRALASRGLGAAILSYRYYGGTMLGAAGDDVQDAIAYLREHAATFTIDPNRVCLLAVSGGAHFFASAIREQPGYIRCLVGLSPAFGVAKGADSLQRVSPLDALTKVGTLKIPVFVSRAGADESGSIKEWSATFIEAAIRKNADVEVHNTPRARHAFELENSEDSRAIFQAVFAFLKRTLTP